jgi:cytidylate kinase
LPHREARQNVIVTISREYGAAGLAVADGVANALEYELFTDDLPKRVAARLGTSAEEVAERASSESSLPERMLAGLGRAMPEAVSLQAAQQGDFDESVRREIERAIRERADLGDVVILGRNAGAVLGRRPGLVRVFLTAPLEWRVARIIDAFGNSRERALADVERFDAARRKVAKDRYKIHWSDARSYDLTIDVSKAAIAGTVSLVVAAVRLA